MSWVQAAVTVVGLLVGGVVAEGGAAYGAHAWWSRRRRVCYRLDEIAQHVAVMRARRDEESALGSGRCPVNTADTAHAGGDGDGCGEGGGRPNTASPSTTTRSR